MNYSRNQILIQSLRVNPTSKTVGFRVRLLWIGLGLEITVGSGFDFSQYPCAHILTKSK